MESVSRFAEFLKGLKANPAQVVTAAIYGKPNRVTAIRDERVTTHATPRLADVCGGTGKEGTGATPAIRMNALLAEFGGRASQSSICDGELSWAMRDIGLVTRSAATRSSCLRGPVSDADAVAPGIQPTCHVEGVRAVGSDLEQRVVVTTNRPVVSLVHPEVRAGVRRTRSVAQRQSSARDLLSRQPSCRSAR